jgi:hypothetical protein
VLTVYPTFVSCHYAMPFFYSAFSLLCSPTGQAISVWIKNHVASSYSAEPVHVGPDHKPISPADHSSLKNNILPLLAASPSHMITVQLASTLKTSVSKSSCRLMKRLATGLNWTGRQLDCSCQLPLIVTSPVASCKVYQI